MSYSTAADVRTQSPFKDSTNITAAYITQKIAEADALIDSIIIEVYVLPLEETPEIIENLSKAIATAFLLKEQNTNIEVEPGVSLSDFWQLQMDILEGIRTRKLKLVGADGTELALQDRISPRFYPTESSSAADAEDTTAPKFTMNQQF